MFVFELPKFVIQKSKKRTSVTRNLYSHSKIKLKKYEII